MTDPNARVLIPPQNTFVACIACAVIGRHTRSTVRLNSAPACAEHADRVEDAVQLRGSDPARVRAYFELHDPKQAPPPLPVGCRVNHVSYEWANDLPGGMGEVIDRKGPWPDGSYEYLVRYAADVSRAPGPDNPECRENWWASYATTPAAPYLRTEATR